MTAVKKYALLPLCGLTLFCARAQMPATNYDESQVPAYTCLLYTSPSPRDA